MTFFLSFFCLIICIVLNIGFSQVVPFICVALRCAESTSFCSRCVSSIFLISFPYVFCGHPLDLFPVHGLYSGFVSFKGTFVLLYLGIPLDRFENTICWRMNLSQVVLYVFQIKRFFLLSDFFKIYLMIFVSVPYKIDEIFAMSDPKIIRRLIEINLLACQFPISFFVDYLYVRPTTTFFFFLKILMLCFLLKILLKHYILALFTT